MWEGAGARRAIEASGTITRIQAVFNEVKQLASTAPGAGKEQAKP